MKNLPQNHDIEAVFPAYSSQGDGTYIYLRDGSCRLYPNQIRLVIRKLAKRQCKDIRLLRAQAARDTQHKQGLTLGINADLVLVAFKVRRPRVEGDACFGYVNVSRHVELLKREKAAALCRAGLAMCSYGQPAPCIQTPSGLQVVEMREYGPLHAEAQALLQLGSGRLLPSLWSYKTTHKYIQDGRAAHSRLLCELQGMLLQFQSENKHTAKLL